MEETARRGKERSDLVSFNFSFGWDGYFRRLINKRDCPLFLLLSFQERRWGVPFCLLFLKEVIVLVKLINIPPI
jgi:hypothetical protein